MQYQCSVREFSSEPVPLDVIQKFIEIAGTAPSGAHKQPWTFCLVTDPEIRREIRKAAEEQVDKNYHLRMSDEWLDDFMKFKTN